MRSFKVLLGLALLGYLLTGVKQVGSNERAVVRRFGAVVAQPGPGLWIGLPWGMDRLDRVRVDLERSVTIGYDRETDDGRTIPAGQVLTGDHNLVNVQATVLYAVDDVVAFVVETDLQQRRADALVARAAESALAEWIAARKVDDVLVTGGTLLPRWLVQETQARLQPCQLGVRIRSASVKLQPPREVAAAFDEVTRAKTGMETLKNKASEQARRTHEETQAKRYATEQTTESDINEELKRARTEAVNFRNRLEQYQRLRPQNPHYLAGIWWDEMGRLFQRMNANGRIDLLDNRLGPDGLDITIHVGPQPKK